MNKNVSLQQRILPPTLLLICLLTMIGLRLVFPGPEFFSLPLALSGGAILTVGLVVTIGGDQQFKKARTPVTPLEAPQVLVTGGLYRYTRNPMYLGFALILAGAWLGLGALSSLIGFLIFVILIDRWYIPYEEARLTAIFGQAYRDYQRRVGRWL